MASARFGKAILERVLPNLCKEIADCLLICIANWSLNELQRVQLYVYGSEGQLAGRNHTAPSGGTLMRAECD
jgi:hypothetical protein